MPQLVTDPATQLGPVEPPIATPADILFNPTWESDAKIKAQWGYISPNYPGGLCAMAPEYIWWDKYGLGALRFSSASPTFNPAIGPSILTWRHYLPTHT